MSFRILQALRDKIGPFLADVPPKRSVGMRYGIAAVAVLLAFAVRYVLHPFLGYDAQYVLFVPALIVAAMVGGVVVALFAGAISILLVHYFFSMSAGAGGAPYLHNIVAGASFVFSALIVAGLVSAVRRERATAIGKAQENLKHAERARLEMQQRMDAENALRENEQKLQAIIDQSPSMMFLKDLEGRYLLVNRAFEAITHKPASEVIGKSDADVFSPLQATSFRSNDLQVLKAGTPLEFEETAMHNDGPHTSIVHKFPLCDQGGKVYALGGIVTDITKRKEAEEALRIAEHGYAALVRGIDGIVWEADAYNYQFSFVSQKAERLFLYPIERWLNEPDFWKNHLHPDDRDQTMRLCIEATNQKRAHDLEYRMIAADGRIVWVRDIVNIIIEHDQPAKLRGVMIDTTEKREAQEALRRSEELLRMTTEAAGIGLWSWNVQEDILELNLGEHHQTPIQLDKIVTLQAFLDLIHPDDRPGVKEAIDECLRQLTDLDMEYRIVRPDGTIRWRRCKGRARTINGIPSRVSGMSLDITEKKSSEEALKAARDVLARHAEELECRVQERTVQLENSLKDIESFCYSIAHDLRAPIRAMRGMSEALLEDYGQYLDQMGHTYCDRINSAADRMDQLISDLLAYGRLSHLELPTVPVNLMQEIKNVLEHSQHQLKESRAKVDIDSPLPLVRADARVLDQVLENLITNALKFVPEERRPHIHIYAECRDSMVRVWVEDNGIGIEPQYRQKIFGAFERLHTTEVYPGTGIGLAIVKRGVEKMGGHVGVESEPGRGSRFWIELPAAENSPEALSQRTGTTFNLEI